MTDDDSPGGRGMDEITVFKEDSDVIDAFSFPFGGIEKYQVTTVKFVFSDFSTILGGNFFTASG